MSQRTTEKVTVGQRLLYVPAQNRGPPREVTVTRVGRKWFEANGVYSRISIETLWVDGGQYGSPGRCWLSAESYEAEKSRQAAWSEFKSLMDRHYAAPADVSISQIENARRALFKGISS